MDHYKNLEKAMCQELEKLDKKYASNTSEMSQEDLEHADMIYHALKSAATYHAMKDAEEEYGGDEYSGRGRSYYDGMSGARYRSPRTGRYISRDDGYSGRGPMEYIDPYWGRGY